MARQALYRQYAAECLALATRASNETDRASLIEMAACWRRLALMRRKYVRENGSAGRDAAGEGLFPADRVPLGGLLAQP